MLHVLALATLTALPPCWSLYDAALSHSAASAHPPYVTYNERISVSADGARVLFSRASVDYRDDGLARVSDERFDYRPFLTRTAEPGPPELGPYGKWRSQWLPSPAGLPIIANVRSTGSVQCTLAGEELYKGHDTYHLTFTGAAGNRPHLNDLWIDRNSRDIWKLIVTGPVPLVDETGQSRGMGSFEVELGYSGSHLVVNHVVWSYRLHEYAQYVDYFGEYVFDGFAFPTSVPDSYFADAAMLEVRSVGIK
jgi:hypothetical protein